MAIRWVRSRDPAGQFKTPALLCTNPQATAADIVHGFVQRWQLAVTFEAVRAPLGVETQRQGSRRAIARTTPVLLGLFSRVTLIAARRVTRQAMPVRCSAG